jgi:uncharacterized protein
MNPSIRLDRDALAAFCRKWRIQGLSLFGSALRDDFRPDSDVDVLVSFDRGVSYGLFEMVHIAEELGAILGREVDLVERDAVEQSENYIRRRHIFETEEPLYVAG